MFCAAAEDSESGAEVRQNGLILLLLFWVFVCFFVFLLLRALISRPGLVYCLDGGWA